MTTHPQVDLALHHTLFSFGPRKLNIFGSGHGGGGRLLLVRVEAHVSKRVGGWVKSGGWRGKRDEEEERGVGD